MATIIISNMLKKIGNWQQYVLKTGMPTSIDDNLL